MNLHTHQLTRRKVMTRFSLLFAIMSVGFLISGRVAVLPQTPPQTREIISDAFTKHRRQGTSTHVSAKNSQRQNLNGTQSKAKKPRAYRLAYSTVANPAAVNHRVAQLGITVWKLRPVTVSDKGATILVRDEGTASEWVPERVHSDTKFREGDYVRLSIESPKTGYLYIVNRDIFADGSVGEAKLIYPWKGMRVGDNLVRPGRIVDIPAQEDNPGYFTARPRQSKQAGELLTFIVSRAPLDLPVSDQRLPMSRAQLGRWEKLWGSQAERFEMDGGVGEIWTTQEQQASLRLRARQLTRDDPAPQTIYRAAPSNRQAFLVNLKLAYQQE